MTINYNVDTNKLTSPPSYYPRVAPTEVLDDAALASQINLYNPNVPASTALMMIQMIGDEVKRQIIAGNWVKLNNFCSFSSSITDAVMANPDDPLPAEYKISLRFKPSTPFVDDVRNSASVSKVGYIDKTPIIASVVNTKISVPNTFNDSYGILIAGRNLRYDPTASDEGVFMTVDGSSEQKMTNVSLIEPSRIVFVGQSGDLSGSVAASLSVRTRYTPNGQLKSLTFPRYIRSQNNLLTTDLNIDFFKPFGASAFADITSATASRSLFTLEKKPTGEYVIYRQPIVNSVLGAKGAEVEITANGTYVVDTDYSIDVTNFSALTAWVQSQGNYAVEEVQVSAP